MKSDLSFYLQSAKVPRHLLPWRSARRHLMAVEYQGTAFLLDRLSSRTLHIVDDNTVAGYTIMDDGDQEVRRHMAAVLAASGRVLKTGLGFGCFVRMCLLKPNVEHIDVVEIDHEIIAHFGKEFAGNPRVTIHHADAFDFPLDGRHWNLAWHDIYCDGNEGLQILHASLMRRYREHCDQQGAWNMPRWTGRLAHSQIIGQPKIKRRVA